MITGRTMLPLCCADQRLTIRIHEGFTRRDSQTQSLTMPLGDCPSTWEAVEFLLIISAPFPHPIIQYERLTQQHGNLHSAEQSWPAKSASKAVEPASKCDGNRIHNPRRRHRIPLQLR